MFGGRQRAQQRQEGGQRDGWASVLGGRREGRQRPSYVLDDDSEGGEAKEDEEEYQGHASEGSSDESSEGFSGWRLRGRVTVLDVAMAPPFHGVAFDGLIYSSFLP